MKRAALTVVAVVLAVSGLSAQDIQPTCRNCPGTYVSNEELQAYVARAIANGLVDQQVRALDVGRTNVDVAVVHRGKLAAPGARSVAEHDQVGEVYHVIDGSATLVTGPDLVDKRRRPADNEAVRKLNGPGNDAVSIRNGVAHELKPGDVMVIPAGTGHWFTKIDDHITYLMIRLDPDKIVPLKDEAASRADLSGTGGGTGRGRGPGRGNP
jgi:mannose-6-phosphate isomerase-like protein (cupin superfamily)